MKAVAVENLEPGMTLARTVTGDNFVVILSENTVLTQQNIERLQNLDTPVVYIKDEFDLSKNFQQAAAVVKKDSAFTHDFDRVSKLAYQVFDELNGDTKAARETAAKLTAKILPMADNSASINYLFDLSHLNTTLALHSERVAIFSGIIAKWMGFKWEEIRTIVSAAFLHDAGKKDFPQELLGKTLQDLEGEDLQTYKKHCRRGYNVLKNAGFDEPIPTIALEHHEHMNGEGFPKNLKGEKIHPFARVVAVADAYDNLTSEREGFTKKTPFDAINFFVHEIYSSFDPAVCVPLLTRIKDSLIGSTITLNDGQKGHIAFYPKDFSSLPVIVTEDGKEINLNQRKNYSIAHYSTSRE